MKAVGQRRHSEHPGMSGDGRPVGAATASLAARIFALTCLVLTTAVLGFGPSAAAAQNIDWVLNLDDIGSDPVPAGGTITYHVGVTNNGTDPAPATTIDFAVPATTTLNAVSGTITGCAPVPAGGPATVSCTVPALASDGVASLNLTVQTSQAGVISLGASVATTGTDDPANNAASEDTTVTAGADVRLDLTGPATAAAGSTVSYTFTATNLGPDPVSAKVLQFPIPTGIANVSPPAGCVLSGTTYQCTIAGPIAAGGTASRVFSGQVSVAAGSTVTAVGTVSGGSPADPLSANDTDTLDLTVTAGSDLRLSKSRAPSGNLFVGDPVSFTLQPSYSGDVPGGITVSDSLPANYAITSISAPGWSCVQTGQQVDCSRPSGSVAGANVSLGTITINADVISSGTPVNTATVASATPTDPNLANNSASDGGATIAEPTIDLRAGKSGPSPALVVVGNSYDYLISTTNIGNTPFFGTLVMTDDLPAGLELTGYGLNGWSCLPAASPAAPVAGPATISCSQAVGAGLPLGVNATSAAVTLQTRATGTGSIVNSMTVSSPDGNLPDLAPGNDTATYGVTGSTGPNAADIAVLKTAGLASVVAGEIQTFDLELVNAGPQPATSITLSDTFLGLINASVGATGAGYLGHVITPNAAGGVSCGTVAAGGSGRRLDCTIASLPVCTAGLDCPVVSVQVRPGGNGGARTNSASATSSTVADPALANNTGSAGFSVDPRADVTVTKTASPVTAIAGQDLTYVITASNIANGLSAADAVTITDTLPANLTFVSASASAGSCSTAPGANTTTGPGNDQLVCNLGTIANGAQRTVTAVVRPNTVTRSTDLTNTVAVTTATVETDTTNNANSLVTPVADPSVDLLVNKTDSVDPVAVGDNTVYTVTLRNLGPSAAENVVMTDLMPTTRLRYLSHSLPADGSCGTVPAAASIGGTLQCSFPLLAAGETRVVTVTMTGDAKGITANNVSIASDETIAGFEATPANNARAEQTTVRTRADVEVASKVPSASPVNLRDGFDFVIDLRNNTGPGLAEADGVVLTDTLPSGMVLTGAPVAAVIAGSVTTNSCTGAAGGTSFSCDLGTLSSGGLVRVTVPVRQTVVTAAAQTITNTASVSTTSLDVVPSNNTNSGAVTVDSSSLSGTIFRDFNDDAAITAGADTGIAGRTVTLSGTAVDGSAVTRTATTDASGNFSFALLPEGSYSLTHGPITETNLTPGTNTPGSAGGSAASASSFTGVALPGNTAATGYLFAKIPTARIGIAKAVQSAPSINPDGSFNATFRLTLRNFSLEALQNVAVTDGLSGAQPLFGTHVSLAAPASDPMAPGSYTIMGAPSGSCGGLAAGFDGDAASTVASGFGLAAGASCTIDLAIRVQPTAPLPPVLVSGGRYDNQAGVTGDGVLSGQTPATNPQLSDLSDNGGNADANGNGIANEAGENDPTPVAPAYVAAIALVKVADISGFSDPVAVGDPIRYGFTVTNTGNVTLTDVTLTDTLPGIVISGGPIASLAPGASDAVTFTATYALTLADLNARQVTNQATATGTWGVDGGGAPLTVQDLSGTDATSDGPTVVSIAGITLVKTVDTAGLSSPTAVGDVLSYGFTVTNSSNVTLSNVTLADPLPGIVITGGPIASLAPGASDSATFAATYVLTQADLDRGQVTNQATATGEFGDDGTGNPLTVQDISGTSAGTDDPTTAPLTQTAAITLVKSVVAVADTNGNGLTDPGDTASYGFIVTNTGNVALAAVSVSDPLVSVSGGPVSLAPGASDSTSFTASYVIQTADLDRGFVENSATAQGTAVDGAGNPILSGGAPLIATDMSDAGTDAALAPVVAPQTVETPDGAGASDGDPANDPTVIALAPVARISLIKSVVGFLDNNGDGFANAGDAFVYGFALTNTGNVALQSVTVTDPLVAVSGGPVDLAVGVTDASSFSASYVLTAADVTQGFVENSALASGTAVNSAGVPFVDGGGAPVIATDVSDTGSDASGTGISGPEAVETPDAAGASDGDPTNDPTVQRLTAFARLSLIKSLVSVTDSNGNGLTDPGDSVSYAFTVTNTGNVALQGVTIADGLVTLAGGPVDLPVGGSDSASFTASYVLVAADLDRGHVDNTAVASGNAVDAAGNPVLDGGGAAVTVSDVSDSGTDPSGAAVATPEATETPDGTGATDGDPANDPTVLTLVPAPAISLIKAITAVADSNANGLRDPGDTVSYSFTVTNTGNVGLGGITVSDPLVSVSGGPVSLVAGASDSTSFTATHVLTAADTTRGYVENTATAAGTAEDAAGNPILDGGGAALTVSDVSDAGTDPSTAPIIDPETVESPDGAGATDGDPANDPTVLVISPAAAIALVKTADTSGFSDPVAVGDPIRYSFTVTNTGNVTLSNVTLTDTLPGIVISGGPIASLDPGASDAATFTATYALTAGDLAAAAVTNQATVTGDYGDDGTGNPLQVTDNSGTATDNDTPTVAVIGLPEIRLQITIGSITDSNGNGITDAGDLINYRFEVTNPGNVTLTGVTIDPATLSLVMPGFNCAPVTLAPGASAFLSCSAAGYPIAPADVSAGSVTLSGTAVGTGPTGTLVTDPSSAVAVPLGLGGLTLTKVAGVGTAYLGDFVPYTIEAANSADGLPVTADLVDILPGGFIFREGSARLDGAAVTPVVSGRRLTVAGVTIAPGATVQLTLEALVTAQAGPGNHVNRARLLSPVTGAALTADATALVRVLAEPVFTCGTIIGRVFDDRNQDGYMNGAGDGEDRAALTDQTYHATGKLDLAPATAAGEPGLPAVRLIAPNGVAVTTDAHGRFSLPCAVLPRSIGSNFMLKLDERTLPSGYRLTTENPRVARLTPGMMTKLNFGATLSRVVRIDLAAKAFAGGATGSTPRPELVEGLRAMVTGIADTPAMLRISYQMQGEDRHLAQRRIRAVETAIRQLWPANGRYQLNIETVLARSAAPGGNE